MKPTPKRSLVVDISNILFRVAAMQKHSNPFNKDLSGEELVGLCMHISLQSIFKWYNKYNPDFLVFAFEGGSNWRKEFTAVNQVRRAYKANRVYDPDMAHFYKLIEDFYTTMNAHTSICCLKVDRMEADDEIAAYTQLYASPEHEIIILSGDKDFTELLKLPEVKLVDPDSGKPRNQPGDKNYQEDLEYWFFLKCVRGDAGDNVMSAFPRVRETKIKKAYSNQYDRLNFMNEVWREKRFNDDGTDFDVVHRVGDLFEQNIVLMSLFEQPKDIRESLEAGVKDQVENIRSYSHFHFLRFCESFNLTRVREDAMKFVDILERR
jgi:5'-3' exonuclease